MIKTIVNPYTNLYFKLKQHINSSDFPWYYNKDSTINSGLDNFQKYENIPFYSHRFISRPRMDKSSESKYLFPEVNSNLTELYYPLLEQIFEINNIHVGCLLRFNANCVHPLKTKNTTVPHVDHNFDHKNLIVYLTDAGGDTILYDDKLNVIHKHSPKEDDIVIFEGIHSIRPPENNRRIVLVATYIEL
jgi:hypothetical protein